MTVFSFILIIFFFFSILDFLQYWIRMHQRERERESDRDLNIQTYSFWPIWFDHHHRGRSLLQSIKYPSDKSVSDVYLFPTYICVHDYTTNRHIQSISICFKYFCVVHTRHKHTHTHIHNSTKMSWRNSYGQQQD